jgi:hypothetical protein
MHSKRIREWDKSGVNIFEFLSNAMKEIAGNSCNQQHQLYVLSR